MSIPSAVYCALDDGLCRPRPHRGHALEDWLGAERQLSEEMQNYNEQVRKEAFLMNNLVRSVRPPRTLGRLEKPRVLQANSSYYGAA